MTKRRPSLFKQRDLTRAIRAGFDAGAAEMRVEIGPMVIMAKKTANTESVSDVKNDDQELAEFRKANGYS